MSKAGFNVRGSIEIKGQLLSINIERQRLTMQLKIAVLSVAMLCGLHIDGRFENGGIVSQKMVMFLVTTLRTSVLHNYAGVVNLV